MIALFLIFLLIVTPVFASSSEPILVTDLTVVGTGESLDLYITASGSLRPALTQYINPSKLIIEFSDAALGEGIAAPKINHPAVRGIRISDDLAKVKVALDLNYPVPKAELVRVSSNQVRLSIPVVFRESRTVRVAPGAYYSQISQGTPQGPVEVNLLKIDPRVSKIAIETRLAGERTLGKAPLSTIAQQAGALAAINGSYFGVDGTPLGLFIQDGRLVTEPILNRSALAVTGDGGIIIMPFDFSGLVTLGSLEIPVSGVNRQRYTNELVVYTADRAETTRTNSFGAELVILDGVVVARYDGNSPIPENGYVLSGHGVFKEVLAQIPLGTSCSIHLATDPDWRALDIRFAVGAGPLLVADGQVSITGTEESFRADIVEGRAPRAAIGVTGDGHIIAVTVNGRREEISVGMTLAELAELMLKLGAQQALNLDGGGSATMVIRGRPVNMPSDGKERQVSSAIVFIVR